MVKQLDNSTISKHLGQTSQYKAIYDPSLLVREPRQANREHLNIDDNNLPFVGKSSAQSPFDILLPVSALRKTANGFLSDLL